MSGDDAGVDQVIRLCLGFGVPPPNGGFSSRERQLGSNEIVVVNLNLWTSTV